MKKLFYSSCLLLLSLAPTASCTPSSSSSGIVGVVNIKRCFEDSALGKKEAADFEAMKSKFSKNVEKVEEELSALYGKINNEDYMESLSSEAVEELRKKFEELSGEYNTLQSQYYQILNQHQMKRLQYFLEEVKKASEIVRAREGLHIILNEDSVLASVSAADQTDSVIKALNEAFENSK